VEKGGCVKTIRRRVLTMAMAAAAALECLASATPRVLHGITKTCDMSEPDQKHGYLAVLFLASQGIKTIPERQATEMLHPMYGFVLKDGEITEAGRLFVRHMKELNELRSHFKRD
jgi:hypothetical protein